MSATVSATTTVSGTGTATMSPTVTATPSNTPTTPASSTPTVSSTPCAITFSDVHASDYFYEPVRSLTCVGVISGYDDNTFRPYNNITRSQLVKVVVLALRLPTNTTGGPHFSDVPATNNFYSFVETAYNTQVNGQRVIDGYSDAAQCAPSAAPCFKPYNDVTRGQIAKIVSVAAGWTLLNPVTPTFTDVLPGSTFYTFIETAYSHNIISGYTGAVPGTLVFRPFNSATRGQVAKIVYLTAQDGDAILYGVARDTWRFYGADVDVNTALPRDNIGFEGAPAFGNYTSPTNIGVYMWSIVAAQDMGLISRADAVTLLNKELTTIEGLRKWNGFLLSWYDTSTAHCLTGPGGADCESANIDGQLISTVDNGWYAAGLVVTRNFLQASQTASDTALANRATTLLNAMNFGQFYDNGDQCTDITAGQMYGGWLINQGPATFHYGNLNTETRIAAYIGIGTHKMPGDVWWRTWRTLPSLVPTPPATPASCLNSNSDFSWQGQWPPQGYYTTYNDPQSNKPFTIFEGNYEYNGTKFVPSWGGSMFEGLMPNLVVPETTWGPTSFGLNDKTYVQASIDWALHGLGFPVWGLSPSSTPDDTGDYDAFGAVGPTPPNAISSNAGCCPYSQYAVTPHASFLALDTMRDAAIANIVKLRQLYPGLYGQYGFYDAVAPKDAVFSLNGQSYFVRAGQVGHRYLVLDQSMIMASLDNALRNRAMQSHFGSDPVGQAVQPYLNIEKFSFAP